MYDKTKHFAEVLDYIQGNCDVPDEVVESVRRYIDEESTNADFTQLHSVHKIHFALRALGLRKYYGETRYIMCRLEGTQCASIPDDVVVKLKDMFDLVQKSYSKLFPEKSFMSHVYVCVKMLEVMGKNDLIDDLHIPLLSKPKRDVHDSMWKEVCNDLGWEFHSSRH